MSMISCSTKPLYRRSYHCRVRRIKKEPTARAISRSRICSLWTRRRSLPSLRVTSKRMRKVGCCLFLQRIRPTIARSAVGASAVYPTTCFAAAYAGRKKSFLHASPISSKGSPDGFQTAGMCRKWWRQRLRTLYPSLSNSTHANRKLCTSWPSAVSIQTWHRPCAKTLSFTSLSSYRSTCRDTIQTWISSSS